MLELAKDIIARIRVTISLIVILSLLMFSLLTASKNKLEHELFNNYAYLEEKLQ